MFKDIRAEAEEYIYKKLVNYQYLLSFTRLFFVSLLQVSQMNEFLELASYDWMLNEPQGEILNTFFVMKYCSACL